MPAEADDAELFGSLSWTPDFTVTELDPGHLVFTGTAEGALTDSGNGEAGPTGGALNGLAGRCAFIEEYDGPGDRSFQSAYCRLTAAPGDAVFIQWSCIGDTQPSGCYGNWYMIGGTGRFDGIGGMGEVVVDSRVAWNGVLAVTGSIALYGYYSIVPALAE